MIEHRVSHTVAKAVPPLLSLIIRRIALRRDAIGSRAGFQGWEEPRIPPQSECDETRTLRSSAAMAQFTGQTLRDNSYDRKLLIFVHSLPLKCKNCRGKKILVTAVVQRNLPHKVEQVYAGVQSSALLLRFNSKTLWMHLVDYTEWGWWVAAAAVVSQKRDHFQRQRENGQSP